MVDDKNKKYIRDFTVEQIVNRVPLYEKIHMSVDDIYFPEPDSPDSKVCMKLILSEEKVISECVECKREMPFISSVNVIDDIFLWISTIYDEDPKNELRQRVKEAINPTPITTIRNLDAPVGIIEKKSNEFFTITYSCSFNSNHKMHITFKLTNEDTELSIMKIGQYPPISMLNEKLIRSFRKELDNHDYQELSKALQLHANGFPVASFVYLRRIYENLVEKEHRKQSTSQKNWDEEDYRRRSFGDQVKLLVDNGADIIPAEIKHHKEKIYRVLSLGIHQYSEQECNQYFDVLFSCITLILEHSIAVKDREKRVHDINAAFQEVLKQE
jgi:hypothetical protein